MLVSFLPTLTKVILIKLAVVVIFTLSVWLKQKMREHERISNRMRVHDERGENCCLWAG